MKVSVKVPTKEYPYLAIWKGESTPLSISEAASVSLEEVVLISMAQEKSGEDLKPYVQYLLGAKQGYFTKTESDYAPLPAGFEVTITQ